MSPTVLDSTERRSVLVFFCCYSSLNINGRGANNFETVVLNSVENLHYSDALSLR